MEEQPLPVFPGAAAGHPRSVSPKSEQTEISGLRVSVSSLSEALGSESELCY